jgi:hypothetical protein
MLFFRNIENKGFAFIPLVNDDDEKTSFQM